jgi:GT2 family glycosyltransferase/glycosyltransferase involved in cell wall biosynthesis
MTQQRVCIVSLDVLGPIRNGGIGTAMTSLAELLARDGCDVTVLYPGAHTETEPLILWKQRYAERGIRLETLYAEEEPREVSYLVHQWLKAHRFDVVHFHDWRGAGYWPCKAKRQGLAHQDTIFVMQVHGQTFWHQHHSAEFTADLHHVLLDWLEQMSVENADVVFSPSQYMLRYMEGRGWKVPAARVVRPNLLPERLMQATRSSRPPETAGLGRANGHAGTMAAAGSLPGAIEEIVFFGRLETRKGLELFCDATAKALRAGAPIKRVTFLGKVGRAGPEAASAYIARATAEWRCETKVLNDFDVYAANEYLSGDGRLAVIASSIENSPYTVLECEALGIPFIAADVGGIRELIHADDQERSLFARNPVSLAAAIARVVTEGAAPVRPAVDFEANERAWLEWHRGLKAGPAKPSAPAPTVSVVISTFNRPKLLDEALRTIEAQTVAPLEVIVVDDASNSEESHAYFRSNRKRFAANNWRVIRNERELWPGASRNRGAAEAKGDFILFMDDDNLARPHEIETFLKAAAATGADIFTCQQQAFTTKQGAPRFEDELPINWMPVGPCLSFAVFENCLGDLNMMIRRSAFADLGGFREEAQVGCEDYELLLRAVLEGYRLETLPEILFYYRVGDDDRLASRYDQRQIYASFDRALEPLLARVDPRLAMAVRYANNARMEEIKRQKVSYWTQRSTAVQGALGQLEGLDLNDARAFVILGDHALAHGQFATASNHYQQALKLNPSLREVRVNLDRALVLAKSFPAIRTDDGRNVIDIAPGLIAAPAVTPGRIESLEDGSLLLRPREDEPTIVRLPQSCPSGAIKVAALVLTDHPKASDLEYAIHVEDDAATPARGRRSKARDVKMRWWRIPPHGADRIEVGLERPLERPGTFYLATRVPEGGSDWFADAKILRLQVELAEASPRSSPRSSR